MCFHCTAQPEASSTRERSLHRISSSLVTLPDPFDLEPPCRAAEHRAGVSCSVTMRPASSQGQATNSGKMSAFLHFAWPCRGYLPAPAGLFCRGIGTFWSHVQPGLSARRFLASCRHPLPPIGRGTRSDSGPALFLCMERRGIQGPSQAMALLQGVPGISGVLPVL